MADSDDDGARHPVLATVAGASEAHAGSALALRAADTANEDHLGNPSPHTAADDNDADDELRSSAGGGGSGGQYGRSMTPASLAPSNAPTPSLMSSVFDPRYSRSATPGGTAPAAFIATYTREYHRNSRVAYNTMIQLPRRLRTAWIVFATGMVFVHHFVERHEWSMIDPVILACAGFSLASKAENCGQVRTAHIVDAVFKLSLKHGRQGHPPQPLVAPRKASSSQPRAAAAAAAGNPIGGAQAAQGTSSSSLGPGSSGTPASSNVFSAGSPIPSGDQLPSPATSTLTVAEEIAIRKEQILTAEMAMLKALDFSVVRRLPFDRIVALAAYLHPELKRPAAAAANPASSPRQPQPPAAVPAADEPPLLAVSKKLLSYSLMTPMCVHLSANEIADGIVMLVAKALGVFVELDACMQCNADMWSVTEPVRAGIERTLYTCLIFADKRTGIATIDDLARLHAQRARRAAMGSSSSGGSAAGGPSGPFGPSPSPTSAHTPAGGWLDYASPSAMGAATARATPEKPQQS